MVRYKNTVRLKSKTCKKCKVHHPASYFYTVSLKYWWVEGGLSDECSLCFKKRRKKAKQKQQAQIDVKKAIKAGIIYKPDTCMVCKATGRINGHHVDYSRTIDVVWLCSPCHMNVHNKNKQNEKSNNIKKRAQEIWEEVYEGGINEISQPMAL